ncbi:MAG: VanZ family protein [Deltaproteobacteria bacterium]|nr:VanZ family protein [Deltaproteobacteria bacterium]
MPIASKTGRPRRIFSDWLPVGLYCFFIFVQSAFPPVVKEPLFPFSDKAAHLFIYAVLGMLFYRAFKAPSMKKTAAAIWAVSASTLYGVSDEIHQAFVPLRTAEMGDLLADALGSALGVGLFLVLFPAFRSPPDPSSMPSLGEIPD